MHVVSLPWRRLLNCLLLALLVACVPSSPAPSAEQSLLVTPTEVSIDPEPAAFVGASPRSAPTPIAPAPLDSHAAASDTAAPPAADWPQLGRDPQRTNAAPQAIAGPYRFYWRWMDVPIASRIQPVVADGRLFVGGLDGVMYALDAAYDAHGGSPRVLWQQPLGSPIRASAGVSGDLVIVGTHHGTLYGLDAATGVPRWSIAIGGALVAAPLIAAGVAYLGSAGGAFYAIRISDGAKLWQTEIGVPILGSAALSNNGSRVFFVAENAKAYALAADGGLIMWQTQLQGQGGADRWPVVLGDWVIFRTMPLRFFHELLHDGDDVLDSAGARLPGWAEDWAIVQPKIHEYLLNQPFDQTIFVLDTATGVPQAVPPVLYTFGNSDPPAAPVVYHQALYLPYRARHGIQNDGNAVHVTSLYDAELGRLDPAAPDVITGLTSTDAFQYQFRLTSDEPATLTLAGDLLVVDSWERLGAVGLADHKLVGIAQVAHTFPECATQCEANDANTPFYASYPFAGPRIAEGGTRAGATIASGRMFWHVLASGLGAIGPANGAIDVPARAPISSPTPAAPAGWPAPRQPALQELRDYVWAERAHAVSVPADLRIRLEQEVERIVATDQHLLPFYLERGFQGLGSWPPDTTNPPEPASVHNAQAYWFDPGELILTLATAYPYLKPALQEQVRVYLQAEMQRYPPLLDLPYPPTSWLTQGRAREPYPVSIRTAGWSLWPPPAVPIQTLYALWAYARYTGDWAYLNARWGAIQQLFAQKKSAIDSYAEIAGAIGYARIAQHFGDQIAADEGESVAIAAMQAGLNFSQWRDQANHLYIDPRDRPAGQRVPVLFGMTPEVGRYLRDTNHAAVKASLDSAIGYPNGSYLWYITRLGIQAEAGESSYHSPELAWSVFLAQAYIEQSSQGQLRYWLDRPWGVGDVWYLQKLIATLEASQLSHTLLFPVIFKQ